MAKSEVDRLWLYTCPMCEHFWKSEKREPLRGNLAVCNSCFEEMREEGFEAFNVQIEYFQDALTAVIDVKARRFTGKPHFERGT